VSRDHELGVRIYYEDTDCGGVVYYANYLRYFERSRTHHLEALGIDMKALTGAGHYFVVRRAELDYRRPGRYGDRLRVRSRIEEVGGASIEFSHTVSREGEDGVLVSGRVRLVSVDAEGRVRRFPPAIARALKAALA